MTVYLTVGGSVVLFLDDWSFPGEPQSPASLASGPSPWGRPGVLFLGLESLALDHQEDLDLLFLHPLSLDVLRRTGSCVGTARPGCLKGSREDGTPREILRDGFLFQDVPGHVPAKLLHILI